MGTVDVEPSRAEGDDAAARDRSSLIVPVWLERTSAWAMRVIVIAVAVGGLLWLMLRLRVVIVPVLIAVLASAALRPAAAALERVGLPRSMSSAAPMLGLAGLGTAAGWFVYQSTRSTLASDEITETEVRDRVEEWLMGPPFDLSRAQIADGERAARSWLSSGVDAIGVEQATLVAQLLGGLVLAVVLTFFFLKDGAQMWTSVTSRVAVSRRDAVRRSGFAVSDTMSAYVRSIVLTGLADAVLIGLGLWILGVPLILPLVILTAVGALFPLVGAVVAGAAAAVVALVAVGPSTALWVIALTLLVQQFEGNVMQPMIVARRVSIHPAVVLVSLTAGGAVAGLAGAFLAVPVVASAIAAVRAFSAQMDVEPPDDVASGAT